MAPSPAQRQIFCTCLAQTLHLELTNKAQLEERINIRESNYSFADKKKFYLGLDFTGKFPDGTFNLEFRFLAENLDDFTEDDIIECNEEIFKAFIACLSENDLLA